LADANGWKISVMLEECGLAYSCNPANIGRVEQFASSARTTARRRSSITSLGRRRAAAVFENGPIPPGLQTRGRNEYTVASLAPAARPALTGRASCTDSVAAALAAELAVPGRRARYRHAVRASEMGGGVLPPRFDCWLLIWWVGKSAMPPAAMDRYVERAIGCCG